MKLKIGNKEFSLCNDGGYHALSQFIDYNVSHHIIYFYWQTRFASDCFYTLKFPPEHINININDFYRHLKSSLKNIGMDLSEEEQDFVIKSIFDEKILILL